jgi:hypothetical protein
MAWTTEDEAMGLFGWFRRRGGVAEMAPELEGSPTAVMGGRERVVGLPYALPADIEEINRLDFQHYMLRFAFRGNYAAPLVNPAAILDVGTGTGRWAIEMAQLFPQANVIGLDVKPPAVDEQAERNRGMDVRPPNYRFVAGNLLEGCRSRTPASISCICACSSRPSRMTAGSRPSTSWCG